MGLGRGGKGTKLSLVTRGSGLPVGIALTGANAHGSRGMDSALDDVAVPQARGRPRKRLRAVAADKGYDRPSIRRRLRAQGMPVAIARRKPDLRHRPKRGRPFGFDREQYRKRNAVERCVGWLKESRYEKLAVSYRAVVQVAMVKLYLKRVCAALSDRT